MLRNKFFLYLFLAIFSTQIFSGIVVAEYQDYPTNKFGMHVATADPNDIKYVAELVNSNGGSWGYITFVIQENDRDRGKWQSVFDQLRELKLIPIIRIATQPEGNNWKRPSREDAGEWANFLNSLNWVVKPRYVKLFNEPNHAQEWGGATDAVNYAQIAKVFAEKLKEKSGDFIIMPAGLDASAPEAQPEHADAGRFIQTMVDTIGKDDFNKLFDAWTSHSYPNPAFAGSPNGYGRKTIRTYEWELELLRGLGIKELPVFITETGWDANNVGRAVVANNFQYVFQNVWLPDPRVKAVTPFILNYQGPPFLGFSWTLPGKSGEFYEQYNTVKEIKKERGNPPIIDIGSMTYRIPRILVVRSQYHQRLKIKNIGQAIWKAEDGYQLIFDGLEKDNYLFSNVETMKPQDERYIDVYFKTNNVEGVKKAQIMLYKNETKIVEGPPLEFEIKPLPSLEFKANLYPKTDTSANDFEIQIFDQDQQMVFDRENIKVENGKGNVKDISNIALDDTYRIVLLKKYYLPRQGHIKFKLEGNKLEFERMYPLDFSNDGALGWNDILDFITYPDKFIPMWMP
ncbi:MAG: hypothetical protein WCO06_06135 [Candidatus Roizmanbacteria bacterium]